MSGDEMNPEDPLPDLIAALDQVIAMAPQMARTARGYFNAFVAEGFMEKQALYLTACQLMDSPGKAP